MKYAAFVYQSGFEDPLAQRARIGIKRQMFDGTQQYLTATLEWAPLVEGGGADGGFALEYRAIEAIGEAIALWKGTARPDGPTEASVLREWLEVERRRVDRTLGLRDE